MPTLYVTAPRDAAADLARTLVEERLAACVNRVPCESTYRWDGEVVVDDPEEVLFVKTSDAAVAEAEAHIAALHPYDVPCIERFTADAVADPFAAWIDESTESTVEGSTRADGEEQAGSDEEGGAESDDEEATGPADG